MAKRPTRLSRKVIKKITQALQLGATHKLACQYAGIDRSTFYGWLRKGEQARSGSLLAEFYASVEQAEGEAGVMSLAVVAKAAKQKDWKAAAWLLERRFGFIKASKLELETSSGEREQAAVEGLLADLIGNVDLEPDERAALRKLAERLAGDEGGDE